MGLWSSAAFFESLKTMSSSSPVAIEDAKIVTNQPTTPHAKVLVISDHDADFLAVYLISLIHPEGIQVVRSEEVDLITPTPTYQRVYRLNTSAPFHGLSQLILNLRSIPEPFHSVKVSEDSEEQVDVRLAQLQSDARYERQVVVEGRSQIVVDQVVTYHPTGLPMTSVLLQTLFYLHHKAWFIPTADARSITVFPVPGKTALMQDNLRTILQILESLPSFASRHAVSIFDIFESIPKTIAAYDTFFLMKDWLPTT